MLRTNSIFWAIPFFLLAAGPLPGEEAVRLEIDEEASRIAADIKATGHRFEAVVTEYDLDLSWNPEREEVRGARLRFDFEDVETGRDRRDREMRDWLEYESFPEAEFVLDALETEGEGLVAKGSFTMHGVEREIAFPVSVEGEGDRVRIRAETTLDHRDWDLEEIRAFLFMTVDPVLRIEIDITAALP